MDQPTAEEETGTVTCTGPLRRGLQAGDGHSQEDGVGGGAVFTWTDLAGDGVGSISAAMVMDDDVGTFGRADTRADRADPTASSRHLHAFLRSPICMKKM
jgi:hypothetical protein